MTSIILRSALVHHGHQVPNDLAYVVHDQRGRHVYTWADVMAERRKRQAETLARKRHVEPWRAVRLSVAYFDQNLFGGWQAFLDDWRGSRSFAGVWIDRDGRGCRRDLMRLFPSGLLPLGSEAEQFEEWKPWFAREYQRRKQCRQAVGVAFLWRRGHELRLVQKPAKEAPCGQDEGSP